jgi:hypothetical protein
VLVRGGRGVVGRQGRGTLWAAAAAATCHSLHHSSRLTSAIIMQKGEAVGRPIHAVSAHFCQQHDATGPIAVAVLRCPGPTYQLTYSNLQSTYSSLQAERKDYRVPRTGDPGRLPPRACSAALLPRWWRSRGCASSADASRDSVLLRLGVEAPAGGRLSRPNAVTKEPEPADGTWHVRMSYSNQE